MAWCSWFSVLRSFGLNPVPSTRIALSCACSGVRRSRSRSPRSPLYIVIMLSLSLNALAFNVQAPSRSVHQRACAPTMTSGEEQLLSRFGTPCMHRHCLSVEAPLVAACWHAACSQLESPGGLPLHKPRCALMCTRTLWNLRPADGGPDDLAPLRAAARRRGHGGGAPCGVRHAGCRRGRHVLRAPASLRIRELTPAQRACPKAGRSR